jgi:replicative DNA helicase
MSDATVLRSLPHAVGPEKSVLSSLMKSPGLMAEHPLDPEIFYLPGHRTMYRVAKERGEVELVSFVTYLHETGRLDEVGGPAAVSDVYGYAPNDFHFDSHLATLRFCHARRKAIKVCAAGMEAAYDLSEGSESENFLQAISGPVSEVFDIASASNPPDDIKALGRQFIEDFEKMVEGSMLPMGIPFGIPEVDRHLPGMHPQTYAIISGRSGGGKSTLATQIFGGLEVGGLYLILERTEKSAFQRCVIQTARIHHGAVTDPKGYAQMNGKSKPEHGDLIKIRNALERLTKANLHIRKPQNRRLATITAEIRRYVRVHGVKVVFIDQIGLIRGERVKGDSGEAELRGISNTLQELAHELHITIVVLCQVTEEAETKGARAIEEDADWWLHIVQERDKKKENFGEHQHVLIAKDSHNSKGGERLPLILMKDTLRFELGYPKKPDEEKAPRRKRFS